MRSKLLIGGGVVVILLGIYALVRPNVLMPAKRKAANRGTKSQDGDAAHCCGSAAVERLVIFSGVGLILLGIQKP